VALAGRICSYSTVHPLKLVRYQTANGEASWARLSADGTLYRLAGDPLHGATPTSEAVGDVLWLAPVESPPDIYGIGLNYHAHVSEAKQVVPSSPIVFTKPSASVTGPGQPIVVPSCCDREEVDYECELAVVIGREAKNVSEATALEYVFGYTCANDVSARLIQLKSPGGQWVRGKGFDTFCPLGPVLVTADEVADPQNLHIRTLLNGQTMQEGHTSQMIFSVAQLISFLSRATTLRPWTVILTGTPQGVGWERIPRVLLHDGDVVEVEFEGIGKLSNPVVDETTLD
jgi:2-keto-4-pentenoate hydratase/2-oxohepta-3-ene-1,7-dioic acid hydratase in catechol pathway